MSDIYISYVKDQKPEAQKLAMALRAIGWTCWFEHVLSKGDTETKDQAQKYATCVIAMHSNRLEIEKSRELEEANEKENLICVAFSTEAPSQFYDKKVHPLHDWNEEGDKSFQILVREIEEMVGPPSKSINWKRITSFFAIVLLGAALVWGISLFNNYNKTLLQDSRNWRAIQGESMTYQSVSDYLSNYPDGKYVAQAEVFKDSLLDMIVWDTLRHTSNISYIEQYLSQFPDALEKDNANLRIDSLKEAHAWYKAQEENSIVSYRVYLELFKEGLHSEEATERVYDIENPVTKKVRYSKKPVLLQTFKTPKEVICLTTSTDGQIIVTRGWNETAWVWDMKGDLISELKGHTDWLSCVAISPNGQRIVTGSWDQTIRVWDRFGNLKESFKAHDGHISAVVFSNDGSHILTGSFDNTAKLFDLKGNLKQVFKGHTRGVTAVSYSPKGNRIATASIDKTVRVWDLTGYELKKFDDHINRVNSIAFSPNGKLIVSGSSDNTIRVSRLKDSKSLKIKGHKGSVNSVTYSSDGTRILSGSSDMTAIEWTAAGKKISTYTLSNSTVNAVSYLGKTSKVLLGGNTGAQLFEFK